MYLVYNIQTITKDHSHEYISIDYTCLRMFVSIDGNIKPWGNGECEEVLNHVCVQFEPLDIVGPLFLW